MKRNDECLNELWRLPDRKGLSFIACVSLRLVTLNVKIDVFLLGLVRHAGINFPDTGYGEAQEQVRNHVIGPSSKSRLLNNDVEDWTSATKLKRNPIHSFFILAVERSTQHRILVNGLAFRPWEK